MLELFMYPVSAVMKAWHILLHSGFGIDDSAAWALSLFGLVLTVRAIIAPFSWMQIKAGRINTLMRPKLRALSEEYEANPSAETLERFQAKQKELREEYNYSLSAGCVPALIQVPVFLEPRMPRPPEECGVPPADRHARIERRQRIHRIEHRWHPAPGLPCLGRRGARAPGHDRRGGA